MRNHTVVKGAFVLALAMSLAGCAPESAPPEAPAQRAEAACEQQHPYPCGGEWPEGLTGPFELASVEEVWIPGHDGTLLHGWVAFPTTPGDVRLPTILSSSPYYDSATTLTVYRSPQSGIERPLGAGWWDEDAATSLDVRTHSPGIAPIQLIRNGYALAYFSVRGTGASGGCWKWGDTNDQLDQVTIIEWIAAQHWSNGRVGMAGLSAPSYSSWQAAINAPAALKTIVTAGDLIDLYQWVHTPQGARSLVTDYYWGQWSNNIATTGGNAQADREGRPDIVQRVGCKTWDWMVQGTASLATGDRNAAYWLERPQSTQLDQVRAAVLDTSGYYDLLGHAMQDSMIWGSLPRGTPLVQVRGWWGHDYPRTNNDWGTKLEFPSDKNATWEGLVMTWFDYWLKGIGPEPRTGVVYHQDQTLTWHEATDWSTERSDKEVLHLSPAGLTVTPGASTTSFQSAPHPLDAAWTEQALSFTVRTGEPDDAGMSAVLCPSAADARLSHVYPTSPLAAPALVAGNPFAFVKLSSDQPGGLVTVTLYDLAPEFSCVGESAGAGVNGSRATGARYMASGSADLEFYSTPYLAHPFPVATPTDIRIDLSDVTYSLGAGHRLALAVSSGAPVERGGSKYTPTITIDGVSELVVPVVEGTLGGSRPKTKYPQRPFTPDGYED